MNKDKLTALCHKVASDTGLTFNSVMTYYFLENVLKKLSESSYNNRFVFKGGYILSNIVGIDTRSTVDIDVLARKMSLDKDELLNIFKSIFRDSGKDSIHYEVQSIEDIKKADDCGGVRIRILCKLDNIRQIIPLDIATGDIVTYWPVDYEYKTVFSEDNLKIQAYNLETMLAEKLETIYSKGFLNSRSKDFYDVHLLYRLKREQIDFKKLGVACERTFSHRHTVLNFVGLKEMAMTMLKDKGLNYRWKSYSNKNAYVDGTSFQEAIESLLLIIEEINIIE